MAKKEANFDLYIHDLLVEAGIQADTQGSNIIEINNALKSASKHKTGNVGFPEYCAVVNDFVLVMEDKADRSNLCAFEDDGTTISLNSTGHKTYAVMAALHYAKHIYKTLHMIKYLRLVMLETANIISFNHYLLTLTAIHGYQK